MIATQLTCLLQSNDWCAANAGIVMREYHPSFSNQEVKQTLAIEMVRMSDSAQKGGVQVSPTQLAKDDKSGLPTCTIRNFSLEKLQKDRLDRSLYHHQRWAALRRCVVCGAKTPVHCFHCGQFMCLSKSRYCFEKFHVVKSLQWRYRGNLVLS